MPRLNPRTSPWALCLALCAACCCVGCDPESPGPTSAPPAPKPGEPAGKLVVYTTFYPTTYFAQRIVGDLAEVVCPLPADADPIFWQPDAALIERYQGADLIVLNGADFEKWAQRVSLPASRVVDTARSFKDQHLRYENALTHSHGPSGAHTHEGVDGHTWLDPQNARAQAKAIHQAILQRTTDPKAKQQLQSRWASLDQDLASLATDFEGFRARGQPPALLASHPAYNYLARRYGWNLVNLDLDPESMPDPQALDAIRKTLAKHPAKHLLWESEPKPEIARRFLDELGLISLVFSPAETLDEADRAKGVDYLAIMRRNIEALRPVFVAGTPQPK